jgi:hypothetical protein
VLVTPEVGERMALKELEVAASVKCVAQRIEPRIPARVGKLVVAD